MTDFDLWLGEEYASGSRDGFTAFAILLKIKKKDVTPQASTFMHVVGAETTWGEVTALFKGARVKWDAVVFFPRRDRTSGGPLDGVAARLLLREQEARVADDRLVINEGHFFDVWGRRMRIDEVPA